MPHHCNNPRLARDALVQGPSAALNRYPTLITSVNNTSQTVPQPSVSQSTVSQPSRLVSRSGQLKASLWKWQRELLPLKDRCRTIYQSSGPCLRDGAEIIQWIFLSQNKFQTSHVSVPRPNRRPSTIDAYRTAIVDTLSLVGLHSSQSSDLNRLLSSFHRIIPKVPETSLSGTYLWHLMSSQKHHLSL